MATNTANGLPYPALTDSNNPPADIQALAVAVDGAYGKAVANAAALPASGAFLGQRIWLTDIKSHATWNGTVWKYDTVPTALTLASGWTGTANLYRRGGTVFLELDVLKSTWAAANPLATLPSSDFYPLATAHLNGRDSASPFTATRSCSISTAGAIVADVAGTNGISGSTQWGV